MPSFILTKVDPGRLLSIANNIGDNITQVDTALTVAQQALSADGGGALKSTWSGAASALFFSQLNIDTENFKSHLKALQELNGQLIEAAGIYDAADNKAQELVNQLKIG
jgi:WXG100 family type VII secretion target